MSALPNLQKGWDSARLHLRDAWLWGARTDPDSERKRVEKAARRAQLRRDPVVQTFRWIAILVGGAFVALLIALATMDWNLLRASAARLASARLGRQVNIDGDLHVHIWTLTPRVEVNGLRVANADWAGGGDLADIGHLVFDIRLVPLIKGRVVVPLIDVEQAKFDLVRDRDGRNNWTFGSAEPDNGPLNLPPIRHFVVKDAQLKVTDERRKLVFTGTINSNESVKGNRRGFWMIGDGTLNTNPFHAEAHGAPLLDVDAGTAYPFTLDIHSGATHVTAGGSITHPFDFGRLQANVAFSGHTLADLYYLTGLALPSTPPYHLTAKLRRAGETYRLDDLRGGMGKSDIAGFMQVDASGAKPYLTANLHSHVVNFDDLGFLFGGGHGRATSVKAGPAPQAKGDITVASGEQPATLFLPDTPLAVDRVRQMDARVRYDADRVDSRDFPLRRMSVNLALQDGVLRIDPLSMNLVRGRIDGSIRIDARHDVPATAIDLRVRDISLQQFFAQQNPPAVEGTVMARAKLDGAGDSVHKTMASANGAVTFVVPHGQMRAAFAELLGINLLNGGIELITHDKSPTQLRCMVASFDAHQGILNTRRVTFDTDVVSATGKGKINLRNETIDFQLSGEPKKFRIGRLDAPIDVSGSLQAPKVGVDAGKALPQAGIGVALGAIVAPIAALLPFVSPGLADDADCGALIREAKLRGAPVKKN
ncbi:MAG TPA: AsmA family protein [Rhizomicrobium sp.]|jgi:hypothetical protein